MEFSELCEVAEANLGTMQLSDAHRKRLNFEFDEIQKQGAELYWTTLYEDHKKFDKNPNKLILPWVLGMLVGDAAVDPLTNRGKPILNTIRASVVAEYRKKHGDIPEDFIKDPDVPDIDLDCLPKARDPIKLYAMEQYGQGIDDGYGPVCSVGTWQTYKFKSAIIDVCAATADELFVDKTLAYALTTVLPEEVNDLKDGGKAACKGKVRSESGEEKDCGFLHAKLTCPVCSSTDTDGPTLAKLLAEHEPLRKFTEDHPDVIKYAVQIIGRVRNMGMHAGALIIADRTLYGNIPMAKSGRTGYWVSMWSEGRNTQLSKFGYIKWDILGLKTLEYIFNCCRFIEMNRGISFGDIVPGKWQDEYGMPLSADEAEKLPPSMSGWNDIDPGKNRAGHFFDKHGNKHYIELNDPAALLLANEQKTDAVFQFDTDLAKSILANGVRNFEDLMLFNAMGHPGPMASIPEAVTNRDDLTATWRDKLDPDILDVLKDTYGVIVYQEQLQAIWQRVAGFTAPEAQEARKSVAKKWTHKLKPIREKWLKGAGRRMSRKDAENWWTRMETFGRYAFNRSHAVSYCLVAHRCLWLKAHFAPEFWAAVMSDCHPDKLVRYMGVARSEGWKPTDITNLGRCPPLADGVKGVMFGTINLNNLATNYTVTGNVVNQGLIGIKGIGDTAAEQFRGVGEFTDIDQFIEVKGGKNKSVLERFIKLGAFKDFPGHGNSYALWQYYRYKYCSGETALKSEIKKKLLEQDGWNDKTIAAERSRQISEYRKAYPKRTKVPDKFNNWAPKPDDSREKILSLYKEDFPLSEVLEFEKLYLGYYLHSPLDLYDIRGECSIEHAKAVALSGGEPRLEVVVSDMQLAETKAKKQPYVRLTVSDGVQSALVFIWHSELRIQNIEHLEPGSGIQMYVDYDESRNTFTLSRGEVIVKLLPKDWRHGSRKTSNVPVSSDA